MRSILLVEDDPITSSFVSDYLKKEGYTVSLAQTLDLARKTYQKQSMDLILLDVSLPDGEGFELAKEFRKRLTCPPIIFITSHVTIEDVRKGFESGGMDYIKKPFVMEELGLRVKRILGDFNTISAQDRYIGAYRFNPTTQTLQYNNEFVILGRLQAAVLEELSVKIGHIVSKNELLEKYWDGVTYFTSRNLDSVIVKLRERFKMDPSVRFLALKKEGYRLVIL